MANLHILGGPSSVCLFLYLKVCFGVAQKGGCLKLPICKILENFRSLFLHLRVAERQEDEWALVVDRFLETTARGIRFVRTENVDSVGVETPP